MIVVLINKCNMPSRNLCPFFKLQRWPKKCVLGCVIPPGRWADLTQPKPNFFLTKLWPSFNIPTFAYTFRSYRYVEGWIALSHVVTYNAWSRNLSFDIFDISVHPQVVWWELRTSKQDSSLLCMCTLSHLQFGASTWSKGFVGPLAALQLPYCPRKQGMNFQKTCYKTFITSFHHRQ